MGNPFRVLSGFSREPEGCLRAAKLHRKNHRSIPADSLTHPSCIHPPSASIASRTFFSVGGSVISSDEQSSREAVSSSRPRFRPPPREISSPETCGYHRKPPTAADEHKPDGDEGQHDDPTKRSLRTLRGTDAPAVTLTDLGTWGDSTWHETQNIRHTTRTTTTKTATVATVATTATASRWSSPSYRCLYSSSDVL